MKRTKVIRRGRDNSVLDQTDGWEFEIEGIVLVAHTPHGRRRWVITEPQSGAAVIMGSAPTRAAAAEAAQARIERYGVEKTQRLIDQMIKRVTATDGVS